MKVKLLSNQGIWTIIAREDPYFDLVLGEAEALGLRRVYLHDNGSVTAGEIVASYGSSFSEVVYGNPHLVREVGINRTFRPCDQPVQYDPERKGWFDPLSGQRIGYARFMTILGRHVYYSDDMPYPRATPQPECPNPALSPLDGLPIAHRVDNSQRSTERKGGLISKIFRK